MNTRTTTDPISLRDVKSIETAPCVYEGDGDNGIEIYFENEENRQTYLNLKNDGHIVLQGNDSDDYIAEG